MMIRLVAEVIDNTTSRGRTLRFYMMVLMEEFRLKLVELGETPIPKYINRDVTPEDAERYQTIYAKEEEPLQLQQLDYTFLNI